MKRNRDQHGRFANEHTAPDTTLDDAFEYFNQPEPPLVDGDIDIGDTRYQPF